MAHFTDPDLIDPAAAEPRRFTRRGFAGLLGGRGFALAAKASRPAAGSGGVRGANVPRRAGTFIGSWGGNQSVGNPFGADQTDAVNRFGAWRSLGAQPVDIVLEMANGDDGGQGNWNQVEGNVIGLLASYGTPYVQHLMLSVAPWPTGCLGKGDAAANSSEAWARVAKNQDPSASNHAGHLQTWDAHFVKLLNNAAKNGVHELYLRPFWEYNLGGNPWYATANATDAANFVTAWRLLIPTLRTTATALGLTVYYVWCPGSGDGSSQGRDELAYPGDDVVDVIAPDVYDSASNVIPGTSTPIYPPAGFPKYSSSTHYKVGDKVSYYPGYYKCQIEHFGGDDSHAPDYHPGKSTDYWKWYAVPGFTASERDALERSQKAGWDYTLHGSGSTKSRPLQFWKDFADGKTLGNYTGGKRELGKAKRFSITEWGLYGRAVSDEGKDNAYWMQQMLLWMNDNIPNDGIAFDTFLPHDGGLNDYGPPGEGYHNIGAPWGEKAFTGDFPNYVAFPRCGFIYQCSFTGISWLFNGGNGTPGATVGPGDAASGDRISYGVANAPGTLTYSTAQVVHGHTTSVLADSHGATVATYVEKNGLDIPTPGMRCYARRTALPANDQTLLRGMAPDGSTEAFRVKITTKGYLSISDSTGKVLKTGDKQIPLDSWFRVDAAVNCNTGDWVLALSFRHDGDDPAYEQLHEGSPYDIPSTAGNFGKTIGVFRFGNCVSTDSGQLWLADMAVGDGPIGPYATGERSQPATAPQVRRFSLRRRAV